LEPLGSEIPRLDALATADSVAAGERDPEAAAAAMNDLLTRYPRSAEVPLTAARAMEGKVYPYYPLKLYQAAIQRGGSASDRHVFDFCIGLFSRYWPGQVEIAHTLLAQHYEQDSHEWARRALDEAQSGTVLDNAWRILQRSNDERLNEPYYKAIYRVTTGYHDTTEAEEDLRVFQEIHDAKRQRHILAVHRWVLMPYDQKQVSGFGYQHQDLTQRNLAELTKLWTQR
jgi:hypothetical protein